MSFSCALYCRRPLALTVKEETPNMVTRREVLGVIKKVGRFSVADSESLLIISSQLMGMRHVGSLLLDWVFGVI